MDKSLVLAEPAGDSMRYRMLETIRQFAQEQLELSGEVEALHRSHLDFTFDLAKKSQEGLTGPDITAWFTRLDLEKDNLYAALVWAMRPAEQNDDIALEMSGGLWMWWLGRGTLSEGRQWLKKALERGQKRLSPRAKALVSMAIMAIMAWNQGDIPEASRCLDESISILRALETPNPAGLANATHMRGHIVLDLGDYPAASQAFRETLDLYRELNDQYWAGNLISDLGMVAYHQGDYGTARLYQEQSLAIFQKYGNKEVTSQTLHRLGELARLEGNYERAEEYYETCLQTYREIGMKLEIDSNLHKLGYVAQKHGDFQKARSRFIESLSIQREAGHKQGIAECLAGLAGLAAVGNQPVRALRLFGAAQSVLESTKLPLAPADMVEWKRDQALACGQLDEATCKLAQVEGQAMAKEQAIEYALRENS